MILISVVDDRYGLTFHRKRLSRDRELIKDICKTVGDGILWIDPYSEPLFQDRFPLHLNIDKEWRKNAGKRDYVFLERIPGKFHQEGISKVILYHWNRHYPSDKRFPIVLQSPEWKKSGEEELSGYSHDKITKEEWIHV